jgi:hypothetical protein
MPAKALPVRRIAATMKATAVSLEITSFSSHLMTARIDLGGRG